MTVARYFDLTRGAIPGFDPAWGMNRLKKELFQKGYILQGPARRGKGLIYKNYDTGEEVRIMPRPVGKFRKESANKHLTKYYYRYRPKKRGKELWHTPIPDKGKAE
jgi:hypothetical protein